MSEHTEHRVVFSLRHDATLKDRPADAVAAIDLLERGNQTYASIGEPGTYEFTISDEAYGVARAAGERLPQEPLAGVLACADARSPVEEVFSRFANDLFVTRVAGNFAGNDAVGALHFAVSHLPSVRAIVVLGHADCGAVTAAADSVLSPAGYLDLMRDGPLRDTVNAIVPSVTMARAGLDHLFGRGIADAENYREAVIAVAIVANAALNAMNLDADLDRDVYYGVLDLDSRLVGAIGVGTGLHRAPATMAEFDDILFAACREAIG